MELDLALAATVKKFRLQRGLTQEELAFKCNLDRTYISLIERKKRNPTFQVLYSICISLEIPLSAFIQEVELLIETNYS